MWFELLWISMWITSDVLVSAAASYAVCGKLWQINAIGRRQIMANHTGQYADNGSVEGIRFQTSVPDIAQAKTIGILLA